MENIGEKRVVKEQERKGLGLKEIILVAVLLAAGAVLAVMICILVIATGIVM